MTLKNKVLTSAICWSAMIVAMFSFVACGNNSHGIPNGKYFMCSANGDITSGDTYWQIKGDKANFYVSGMLTYENCEIYKEDEKVYFDYAFSNPMEAGHIRYEINYNNNTKILKVDNMGSTMYFRRK